MHTKFHPHPRSPQSCPVLKSTRRPSFIDNFVSACETVQKDAYCCFVPSFEGARSVSSDMVKVLRIDVLAYVSSEVGI